MFVPCLVVVIGKGVGVADCVRDAVVTVLIIVILLIVAFVVGTVVVCVVNWIVVSASAMITLACPNTYHCIVHESITDVTFVTFADLTLFSSFSDKPDHIRTKLHAASVIPNSSEE